MLSTPSPLNGQFAVKRDENQLSTAPKFETQHRAGDTGGSHGPPTFVEQKF